MFPETITYEITEMFLWYKKEDRNYFGKSMRNHSVCYMVKQQFSPEIWANIWWIVETILMMQ